MNVTTMLVAAPALPVALKTMGSPVSVIAATVASTVFVPAVVPSLQLASYATPLVVGTTMGPAAPSI